MKLRKGERIACSKDNQVGEILADVPDDKAVPTEALSISGPLIPDVRQGYVCGQCDEVVALLEDGSRWRVRTSRGWVS